MNATGRDRTVLEHRLADRGLTGEGPAQMLSHTGRTRDGQPLAFNHAPSNDIMPYFNWFSATSVEVPGGVEIADGMLNDHAIIRILFGGHWTAETADGTKVFHPGEDGMTLYFGPQTKVLPITVSGDFKVISIHLAAGGASAMGGPSKQDMLDQILDYDELVGHGKLSTRFKPDAGPADWLKAFEKELRTFLALNKSRLPDPVSVAFEHQMLANPSIPVTDFAASLETSKRTVERIVKRDYGLTPKQVARRARALDMAAALLGVAMEEEEAALRLRYFDQPHLIREIRHFFGTTPKALKTSPHPLLRLNLEVRQARRLQALAMLPPDRIEPWRDPEAEPK